jgi:hypothetical protein
MFNVIKGQISDACRHGEELHDVEHDLEHDVEHPKLHDVEHDSQPIKSL